MSKRKFPSPSRRQVVHGILATTAFGATAKLLPGCTTPPENQAVIAELQEMLDKGWRKFQP